MEPDRSDGWLPGHRPLDQPPGRKPLNLTGGVGSPANATALR
ncbi:hypothetical protein [Streptomyces iranensis]|uniref:Uncharacterized protein n=1 Tax=Streptomyces iranensis TaxID=576784 RepID=A0ABS4N1I0_9ACTN|nr:hypothetical protein [Streptomyces iranensis]MBP2065846.1 hypothetical protein [Streptomyces iranensis]